MEESRPSGPVRFYQHSTVWDTNGERLVGPRSSAGITDLQQVSSSLWQSKCMIDCHDAGSNPALVNPLPVAWEVEKLVRPTMR